MKRVVYKELDNLCKDFMNLTPESKKGVLLNAKRLLKVQQYSRALSKKKRSLQALSQG
jgi:hypothetical protein